MRLLLLALCTLCTLESVWCHAPVIISSPRVTNLGDWHVWENCPDGTYVTGMQLKTEARCRLCDNTALNGIRLFCAPPNGHRVSAITSGVQIWGQWGSERSCSSGVATEFQLRSERSRGPRDDTAANNLNLACSNGQDVKGDGTDFGDWTAKQQCPAGYAICGLQTQIEPPQGGVRDDTALNNVNMKCCYVLSDAELCTPRDEIELVKRCANTHSKLKLTCSYTKVTGVHRGISTNVPADDRRTLREKFSLLVGKSSKTKYNWKSRSSLMSQATLPETVSFKVKPGESVTIRQVVGKCGPFKIYTNMFLN